MLLSALLAPLACAASAVAPPDVQLLRLAPDDALVAARVRDVRGLLSRRETNRWVAFLTDPAWQHVFAGLRDADGEPDRASAGRAEAVVADVVTALGTARSAVAMLVGAPGQSEPPLLAFAALGGDALHEPLLALMRGAATETRDGDLQLWAADGGVVEAYFRRGDLHFVVDAPDAARAVAFGRAALARLDAGAPLGGRLAAYRDDVDAEASVDLSSVWRVALAQGEVPEAARGFLDAIASVEWLHGRLKLGAGEHMDLTLEAPYREEGLAQQLFGAFQPCDAALLGLAPSMAISVSAGKADLSALARLVLAEIGANAPEQQQVILGALDAVKGALGIDVLDDLVGNLTGDYVSFSLPADMLSAKEATTAEVRATALDMSCTAFGLRDAEPFLGALETALDLTAGRVPVETMTLRGADVWTVTQGPTVVHVAVNAHYLCVAMDLYALESFLARVNGDADAPPSFLSNPAHATAAAGLRGTYVSLAPTRSSVAFLGNTCEVLGLSLTDSGDAERYGRALLEAGRLMESLGHLYFAGLLRGQLSVEGGLVRARTEAR